ncbi:MULTISPECIES: hypothetical protein [unclassified Devosia]|uniref:hypothetical protein n=1 Tax=unclassified Devosia TaxID=196773 RepID=UPI00145F0FC6|nr:MULTISPECIES: hypothetical protein [unclassified Devosia]MBJ6988687.1 hypothetical protein [Devosia sp. MC521]MBK1794847.1 hypothetical protein [Devosia sp. WQ 349K1]QMW62181.1 hypothetical protein H4N61_14730 [Devosia sp. MC521]
MAISQAFDKVQSLHLTPAQWLRTFVSVLFPLGVFGLVNFLADPLGMQPLFFSPFGMPGWIGAIFHLSQLACLGAAYAAITRAGSSHSAGFWVMLTTAGFIALPFATSALDPFQLTLAGTSLFLLTVGTLLRVAPHSQGAVWFMTPALVMVGLATVMGLLLAASYLPPFAPIYVQTHSAAV